MLDARELPALLFAAGPEADRIGQRDIAHRVAVREDAANIRDSKARRAILLIRNHAHARLDAEALWIIAIEELDAEGDLVDGERVDVREDLGGDGQLDAPALLLLEGDPAHRALLERFRGVIPSHAPIGREQQRQIRDQLAARAGALGEAVGDALEARIASDDTGKLSLYEDFVASHRGFRLQLTEI